MEKLIFIDDDEEELKSFDSLVTGEYKCVPLRWPWNGTLEEVFREPPALFVSDLYLPPPEYVQKFDDFSGPVLGRLASYAEDVGNHLQVLFPGPENAKKRLKDTMEWLGEGRELLDRQWRELAQSPEHGLRLFQLIHRHRDYGTVPFVFYSRKITPEDVVAVLSAGATSAIRKKDWTNHRSDFLNLLREAQELYRSDRAVEARRIGLNVNVTLSGKS